MRSVIAVAFFVLATFGPAKEGIAQIVFESSNQALFHSVDLLKDGKYAEYVKIAFGKAPIDIDAVNSSVNYLKGFEPDGFNSPSYLIDREVSSKLRQTLISFETERGFVYFSFVLQEEGGSWQIVWTRANASIAEFKDMF